MAVLKMFISQPGGRTRGFGATSFPSFGGGIEAGLSVGDFVDGFFLGDKNMDR